MGEILLISGFLGAGKTTLIRHILDMGADGPRTALLENEFGTCSVDDLVLRRPGLAVRTLASGCICCSLAGPFEKTIGELARTERPERLLIEPSGVAGMGDLLRICQNLPPEWGLGPVAAITVVDAEMHPAYREDMGTFYLDQIRHAGALVCSKLDLISPEEARAVCASLAEENPGAAIFACPWEELDVQLLLEEARARTVPQNRGHTHHHHGGAVFTSLVLHPETPRDEGEWQLLLSELDGPELGRVLRAKGFLPGADGMWYQVDYTLGRVWLHSVTGVEESRLVVIGTALEGDRIAALLEADRA